MSNEEHALKISTSDGVEFTVTPNIARQSKVLADFLQSYQPEMDAIPLKNVDAKTFEKVIEYCEHHADSTPTPLPHGGIGEWDSEFLKVDQNTLFNLIMAANYLSIKRLLDVTTRCVGNMLAKMPRSQIRATFLGDKR